MMMTDRERGRRLEAGAVIAILSAMAMIAYTAFLI